MPTTQDIAGHNTPELVCVLDRQLPRTNRAMEALGRNMRLYADGEEFPGFPALQHCAWEGMRFREERFNPLVAFDPPPRRNLRAYPQALAQKIREGNTNMSILLNTIGGFVGYIGLFRSAVRHILDEGGGTVRTFAVTAYSAGADIGLLAPKSNRYVTRRGKYLWHTTDWDADEEEEHMKDIIEIQWALLQNTCRKQRQKIHQLLLNTLANMKNKDHEIILSGEELQDLGIVRHMAQDPEELTALFLQRTGVRPDFWIPGHDPVARFFSHAALEERAELEGYTLSFPRLNAVRNFFLRSVSDQKKRNWRDVREDLLDYATEFPWRMVEILRGPSTSSG